MKFIFNNKEYPGVDGVMKAYYEPPAPPGPDYTEPFYIQDLSGSENTITLSVRNSMSPIITPYYSFDKENWVSLGATGLGKKKTVVIPANSKVYFRCKTEAWAYMQQQYGTTYGNEFGASGDIKAGGNIMSLLYGEDFTGNETTFPSYGQYTPGAYPDPYPLGYLFHSNTHLISVSDLLFPATTLVDNCYYRMFYGCSSLTNVPVLPATTLARSCYSGMFYNCTSLTTAPTLPVTTLARSCYSQMFGGCSSLTTAPALPATTLAYSCCYQMFKGCTSLTTAPELPATTLDEYCYSQMFYGCTSLNYIKCLATNISAANCLSNWVYNVPSGGTFTKKAGVSWSSGTNGIPSGWAVVEV